MNAEELLKRYASGERVFNGVDLQDADLSGAKLQESDFRQANFSGANLSGADLCFCVFSEADLSNANLEDSVFQESVLNDANCEGANFRRSVLGMVSLDGANFRGANFEDIEMIDCGCRNTIWPNGNVITDPGWELAIDEDTLSSQIEYMESLSPLGDLIVEETSLGLLSP